MEKIDFLYKYIPVSNPKNTVKNDFLSGDYFAKEVTPLATKTTMTLKNNR